MDTKILLVFLVTFKGIHCDCPAGWTQFKNRCYYVSSVNQKFNEALSFCGTKNASLPIYYSDDEWTYLHNITMNGPRTYQWVGLHLNFTTKTWSWVDGQTAYNKSAIHWYKDTEGKPPNNNKAYLCAGMNTASKGATYILNCVGSYKVVCQRPANVADLCDANDGWKDVSGKCYKYFPDPQTWRDARKVCQQYIGDLAVPANYLEMLLLGDLIPCKGQASNPWIGISDTFSPGRYLGVDQKPPYQRWANPVRYPVSGDSCLISNTEIYNNYDVDSCIEEHPFVCQRSYGECPQGWTTFEAYCYQYHGSRSDLTTWFGAKNNCESQGSELLTVANEQDQKFVSAFFKKQKIRNTWLAFSDYNDEGTLAWAEGIRVVDEDIYSHFAKGYPRTLKPLLSCGLIQAGRNDALWSTTYCFSQRPYICQLRSTLRPKVFPSIYEGLGCETGWTKFRQDCYQFGNGKTRQDALDYCKQNNAVLTTVRDPLEQSFLVTFKPYKNTAWIGLTYHQAQDQYLWDDYTPPQFYNYYPKEPNDKNRTCIQMVGGSRAHTYPGTWEDQKCDVRNSFICRKPIEGVTTLTPTGNPTATWTERCGGPGWVDNNLDDTCYQINTIPKNWADARQDCRTKGGDLLSISGPTEQIHIQATLGSSQFASLHNNMWIGGSDRNDEGGWEWSDGSPFRYLNWHPGEPNMVGQGQNCMVLTLGAWNYQWDNAPCTQTAPYICKRAPTPDTSMITTTTVAPTGKCIPIPVLSGNYSIPDFAFSSSASSDNSHGPEASRITPSNTAFWNPLRSDTRQYITANFYNVMVIKGIVTKGRQDNTQWVTKYQLKYQLNSASPWYDYENPPGTPKIFDGNVDGNTPSLHYLEFPIEARSIKLVPVAWQIGISLRWELYGCIEEECVSEYGISGPLIVEDGGFKASSIADAAHDHSNSRLVPIQANQPLSCWKPLSNDKNSWIEVTFDNPKVFRGITVMGNPSASEWVTKFKVAYQFDDSTNKFQVYQEPYGTDKIFNGNTNTSLKVTNMFISHFQAKKIRIYPLQFNGAVALRFDVLVCPVGCQDIPLISGDHKIPDEQLKASSQFDNDHGPMRSRLNAQVQGALMQGWLAEYNDNKQYIQVDLGETLLVTAIATQGRADRDEWVRAFKLTMSLDGSTFAPYYVGNDTRLFDGNWDASSVYKQYLPAPVLTRYVQLWPTDWQKRIALRWEVYGCPGPASSTQVGCFADRAADRDLAYEALSDPETGLWPPMCIRHCYLKGYYYAAVQNRDKCFCGNSYGKYGVGRNCSLPCYPREQFMCGGTTDNLVYRTGLNAISRVCPPGWEEFNDRCYVIVTGPMSWSDSRTYCQKIGGDLAAITDQHEQDFVFSLTTDAQTDVWLGFNDLQREMLFEWANDEEVLYTNWNLQQPSNPSGTEEDCVVMTFKTGGWQDERCDINRNSVCEMEKKPTDKPTETPEGTGCLKGWDGYRDSCYLFVSEMRNWKDAAKVCRSYGGNLIQVNDMYESSYISSQLGSAQGFYWSDVTDNNGKGRYIFSDGGSTLPLTNWALHKPDSNGQCVGLGTGKTAGLWYNLNCTSRAKAVCERLHEGLVRTIPVTTPPSNAPCPDGWDGVGSWCYQVNNVSWHVQRAWADAQDDCVAKGSQLASFHNMSDLQALFKAKLLSGSDHFWIGLNDLEGKGYRWTDGTPFDLSNWGKNEPNNYKSTAEDCVELRIDTGKFNDQDCSKIRNWICGIRRGSQLVPVTTVTPPTPGPVGICPNPSQGWQSYNNNCYLVIDGEGVTAKTWRQARDTCRNTYNADLASITSQEENLFIASLTKNVTAYSLWIGLNELNSDQGYRWSDNTPASYFNWNLNEPNDYLGLEACVDMFIRNGKWNDDHCDITQGFICKWRSGQTINTVPTVALPGNCPKGYSGIGNKCFKIFGQNRQYLNFTSARAACQQESGSLASINNVQEQAFLTTLLVRVWWSVWIGLYQRNGQYSWDNNDEAGFFGWAPHEPRSKGKGCVAVYGRNDLAGQWLASQCSNNIGYVCQVAKQSSISTPEPITTKCDTSNGFRTLDDDCYLLVQQNKKWSDARSYCQGLGSDLASINTVYERSFLLLLANENGNKQPIWTGLNDQDVKGKYRWSDGWPVVETFWGPHQPNSTGCAAFRPDGYYYDESCDNQHWFFCRTTTGTPPVTPAPGTGQCPGADWQGIGSSCYRFNVKQYTSYEDSVKYCTDNGGQLLSIHDNITNDYIYTVIREQTSWAIWLGLRGSSDAGYKWLDKSPVDFTNWDNLEPKKNDSQGEPLQCARMLTWGRGKWSAASCDQHMGVVCVQPMSYDTQKMSFPSLIPFQTPPKPTPTTNVQPLPTTTKSTTTTTTAAAAITTTSTTTTTRRPVVTRQPIITIPANTPRVTFNQVTKQQSVTGVTPAQQQQNPASPGLGGGAIAGIVIAAVVIICVTIVVVIYMLRKPSGLQLGSSRSFSNALYESSSATDA